MGILSKKLFPIITIAMLFSAQNSYAQKENSTDKISAATGSASNIELNIKDENKLKVKVNEPIKEIKSDLFVSQKDAVKNYFQIQKKMDVEDIKSLWESTIERNQVIKFAVRKLALPAEQRRVHSSLMSRSISALISGASILPGVLGADTLTSTAASASGSIANRIIENKAMPKEMPLSDTELIQLARLVEELQNDLIKTYYGYKGDLEALKVARQNLVIQNKVYSEALISKEKLDLITSKSLYDKAIADELEIKQKIKLERLKLERLAGANIVEKLCLGKIADMQDIENSEKNSAVNASKTVPVSVIKTSEITKKEGSKDLANTDLKKLACEVSLELEDEHDKLLADLDILWKAAVERSETIRFAIYKLSNPNGEVEKNSMVKKILSPLASVTPLIGLGTGNPATAASTMFSGSFLNSLLADGSEFNSKLSKVTDTDLILLAQETENLQQKLVDLYYNYVSSLLELNQADKSVESSLLNYENSLSSTQTVQSIADILYRDSLDNQYKLRQKVLNARVALEQFVGNDALVAVDKNIRKNLACEG